MDESLSNVVLSLRTLAEDESAPKNTKVKIKDTIGILENTKNPQHLSVCRALEKLEELSENLNIEPFIRTELMKITSDLERLRS